MTKEIIKKEKGELSPIENLKSVINLPSVQEQFKNALKDNSDLFVSSIIDLVVSDKILQECNPNLIVMECLKAATLRLPINKNLGFAYIVPYKNKEKIYIPQFQVGYKGIIQLALRTGQYARLNDAIIYEGQSVTNDIITGDVKVIGDPDTSKQPIGYLAYFKLINGFEKCMYVSKENALEHGKKFSPSFNISSSPWKTNTDAMCIKTCWKKLLSKFGVMSVEMVNALSADSDEVPINENINTHIMSNANQGDLIDFETGELNKNENKEKHPDF